MNIKNENGSQSVQIKFEKIDDVKNFVNIVNQYDFDITLSSEKYTVDAKSIMGIFSLELSDKINLTANTQEKTDLFEKIEKYIV